MFAMFLQIHLYAQKSEQSLKLIEVHKIWDKAPHNAFTDLFVVIDKKILQSVLLEI